MNDEEWTDTVSAWHEKPGDRYLYQPAGHRGPHWHEFIRLERGRYLPEIVSRCVSGVCARRR